MDSSGPVVALELRTDRAMERGGDTGDMMKIRAGAVVLFTGVAVTTTFACSSTTTGESSGTSGNGGSGTSGGANGTSGAAQASGGAGESGCGVIGVTGTACGQCLVAKCCDLGKACQPDEKCASCVARSSDSVGDPSCQANPSYKAVFDCVNGPCTTACNGTSSSGGSSSGGSCSDIQCGVEGPAGDKICSDKGCGPCFFGRCNTF